MLFKVTQNKLIYGIQFVQHERENQQSVKKKITQSLLATGGGILCAEADVDVAGVIDVLQADAVVAAVMIVDVKYYQFSFLRRRSLMEQERLFFQFAPQEVILCCLFK